MRGGAKRKLVETSLTTDGMRLNTRHRKWRLVVVVLAVSVAPILPHEPFLNQRTKGPISARPAQPFDAGDFYSSPAGKHRLLRLAQPAAEHTASLAKVKSHRATAAFVEPDSGLLRITTDEILLRLKPQVDPRIYFGASWPRVRRLAGTREQFILTLRSEEHTSELQSRRDLVCRLLLEKKKKKKIKIEQKKNKEVCQTK